MSSQIKTYSIIGNRHTINCRLHIHLDESIKTYMPYFQHYKLDLRSNNIDICFDIILKI